MGRGAAGRGEGQCVWGGGEGEGQCVWGGGEGGGQHGREGHMSRETPRHLISCEVQEVGL